MTQRPETFCVLSQGSGLDQSERICQHHVFDKKYVLFVSHSTPCFKSECSNFGAFPVLPSTSFSAFCCFLLGMSGVGSLVVTLWDLTVIICPFYLDTPDCCISW